MNDYTPTLLPIPADERFPKLRIDCFGKHSVVYINGVAVGTGVQSVKFEHLAGESARVEFSCNADTVSFAVVEREPALDTETSRAGEA